MFDLQSLVDQMLDKRHNANAIPAPHKRLHHVGIGP
jgi:hypothetical protein